jgi:hypothetical protein
MYLVQGSSRYIPSELACTMKLLIQHGANPHEPSAACIAACNGLNAALIVLHGTTLHSFCCHLKRTGCVRTCRVYFICCTVHARAILAHVLGVVRRRVHDICDMPTCAQTPLGPVQ